MGALFAGETRKIAARSARATTLYIANRQHAWCVHVQEPHDFELIDGSRVVTEGVDTS